MEKIVKGSSKNTFVSVLLPVFNEEKFLAKCLDSLTKQRYKNYEVIVVDDGSTDRSVDIAKKFNIKLYRRKHSGTAGARNFAAKKAKGSIFVFADADMRYDKDYIENLTKPIRDKKTYGTFTKEEFVANSDNVWAQCWNIEHGLPSGKRVPDNYPSKTIYFRALSKELFEKAKGYSDGGYGEDEIFHKKLGIYSTQASGAVSYHYNPDTLTDVFFSARWIGRSNNLFTPSFKFFKLHFFPKSFVSAYRMWKKGAPSAIFVFKLVYDFGILVGIFLKKGNTAK